MNEMIDYDHLVGYLHSKTLRWSYGAMRYRETDRWLSKVSAEPIDQLVPSIVRRILWGFTLIALAMPIMQPPLRRS